MSGAPVLVRAERAIGTITLNRADKRNALNAPTIDGIRIALAELESEADIHVIVLRGDGPDFCAGADLAQLERLAAGADSMENLRDAQHLGDLFISMRRASKPIVAAVHGTAIAGGAGLAGACDIILASDNAVFGYP
jgi:methylglutaconyl-CoA hydratase